jgi:hypothetical protein
VVHQWSLSYFFVRTWRPEPADKSELLMPSRHLPIAGNSRLSRTPRQSSWLLPRLSTAASIIVLDQLLYRELRLLLEPC